LVVENLEPEDGYVPGFRVRKGEFAKNGRGLKCKPGWRLLLDIAN
jgi:hypothetical protein